MYFYSAYIYIFFIVVCFVCELDCKLLEFCDLGHMEMDFIFLL